MRQSCEYALKRRKLRGLCIPTRPSAFHPLGWAATNYKSISPRRSATNHIQDENRPICIRCKKRGLLCDGPKDVTWINENPPSRASLAKQSDSPYTSSEKQSPQPSPLGGPLTLAAFEDDVCLVYTRKKLLRGGPVDIACQMVMARNSDMDNYNEPGLALLRNAMLSLSILFFGKQHNLPTTTSRGYRLYGLVLAQLNSHLAMPQFQTTRETILTVLTCNLLEIFLPTGRNHFLKHIRGLESILAMRGPPTLPLSEIDHTIFSGLRTLLVLGGLAMSTPTIYAREEWKAIPSKNSDENSKLRLQILNLLADCTRLLHARDAMLAGCNVSVSSLIDETKLVYQRLEALYMVWASLNDAHMKQSTSIYRMKAQIANKHLATTYMLYHTTAICVLNILDSLEPSPRYVSLRNASAIKITKCLELKMFEKRPGGVESNTIGFVATKVAWTTLGGFNSPEGRKLARAVRKAVDDVFAIGAWEIDPDGSPRISPSSPDRVTWIEDPWSKEL
ncbi:hypothetical protein CC78DRAFT_530614 [Lojkania enalia]|uniref:Zn(2)-C6 fungal-type domain-containing protein n=1 Tax=Lojkania enalia TaxID=147567 RepID=A0A9P4KFW5_9PLEO|nr:hypothetical protein CC78DRAFT_530614 [Didymosphaeria enalia]